MGSAMGEEEETNLVKTSGTPAVSLIICVGNQQNNSYCEKSQPPLVPIPINQPLSKLISIYGYTLM